MLIWSLYDSRSNCQLTVDRRILVAVDGSKESMAAADRSIQLAEQNNSELIVVNVLQLPMMTHYTTVLNSAVEKETNKTYTWFEEIKKRAAEKVGVKTKMIESFGSTLQR